MSLDGNSKKLLTHMNQENSFSLKQYFCSS